MSEISRWLFLTLCCVSQLCLVWVELHAQHKTQMNSVEAVSELALQSKWLVVGNEVLDSKLTSPMAIEFARSQFQPWNPASGYVVIDSLQWPAVLDQFKLLFARLYELGKEGKLTSSALEKFYEQSVSEPRYREIQFVELELFLKAVDQEFEKSTDDSLTQPVFQALQRAIVFNPLDQFQSHWKRIQTFLLQRNLPTPERWKEWVSDLVMGSHGKCYAEHISFELFLSHILTGEKLDSSVLTQGDEEALKVAIAIQSILKGAPSVTLPLTIFYPQEVLDLPRVEGYQSHHFSKVTGAGDFLEARLLENQLRWLKEYEGSTVHRLQHERRSPFHDPYW
ncbi:MAG: hypothetical protein HY390_03995 [Deltaproteobacteria bacterium]|nr:hypothetical protein [Deltaproteobacteria bacterium]